MRHTPSFLRHAASIQPQALEPILRLWLLRMVVPLGGHKEFLSSRGFSRDAIAYALGLGDWVDSETREFDPKAVLQVLRKAHVQCEKEHAQSQPTPTLVRNVQRIQKLAGLSDTECRILEFSVLLHSESLLDDAADFLGQQLTTVKVMRTLAQLLDLAEADVRHALGEDGLLTQSGLVKVDRRSTNSLRHKLDLLNDNFADSLLTHEADPIHLLRNTVTPATTPTLGLDDYAHIQPQLAILQPYLQKSLETARKGVNIFLYGAPGTGKSELAKVLAKELNCELFEIASEDDDGDPVNGGRRLRAFRAAQCFFGQRRSLIVFDEVEDVFDDGDNFGHKSTAQTRKAWINRTLEENPVPALWLSNSIDGLDRAFIRRFDMVLELPIPPKRQRERILRQSCGAWLDSATLARLAQPEQLAPAVVTKAASVVELIRTDAHFDPAHSANALLQLVGNTLQAQGHAPILAFDAAALPATYDPAFIHTDANLSAVASGLARSKQGRLCLYGPPGTGKTAYGKWLAVQLDMPLVVKRVSDLQSPYLGVAEKNIARAFRDAQQEGAILLIDEVDSFLQDRRGAERSWEISQVNEMLTQMEAFSGIFIASTNLMTGLDQAALRRFDLKVKFDYLRADQAIALLHRHSQALNLPEPTAQEISQVARIRQLTPGDFAAVMRQNRFRPLESNAALTQALCAEAAMKEGAKAEMGFVASSLT